MSVDSEAAAGDAPIVVRPALAACEAAAAALAASLGLPLAAVAAPAAPGSRKSQALAGRTSQAPAGSTGLILLVTPDRLELQSAAARSPGPIWVDFVAGTGGRRLRQASLGGELLARAAGIGPGTGWILDATAGLGGDAALLAVLGCRVTAVERHPVVAALLEDGVRRARQDPVVGARLGDRLTVVAADARTLLAALAARPAAELPDVVLIDPMFPPKRGSAAPRKEMQLFRALVGGDEDAGELLVLARKVARRRVVVKRHAHAPPLADQAPDVTYRGRSTRYDAYVRGRA